MKNLLNKLLLTLELNNPFKSFPYILLICLPILIYLGERSFISYDEGYYALQGKWVLEYNNWITPQWFDQIQFDRPRDNTFPFWNQINGPISDAIWHSGQVVMNRRASGNPLRKGVNVFLGKTTY